MSPSEGGSAGEVGLLAERLGNAADKNHFMYQRLGSSSSSSMLNSPRTGSSDQYPNRWDCGVRLRSTRNQRAPQVNVEGRCRPTQWSGTRRSMLVLQKSHFSLCLLASQHCGNQFFTLILEEHPGRAVMPQH